VGKSANRAGGPQARRPRPDGAPAATAPSTTPEVALPQRLQPPVGSRARGRAPTAASARKRALILREAEALFHAQGYERTTLAQIAERLGVTKPYLYYYFHNKQHIFETLSWAPAVACFGVLDDADLQALPAHRQCAEALRRLIAATLAHHPAAFFVYREPQAYRDEYRAEQTRLAHAFYDRFGALLERARAEGTLQFNDTRVTALAACSIPGFLYSWYRPDGRLSPEAMVDELSALAWRVIGLGEVA
jgi:AcrR family transcriptional regulator